MLKNYRMSHQMKRKIRTVTQTHTGARIPIPPLLLPVVCNVRKQCPVQSEQTTMEEGSKEKIHRSAVLRQASNDIEIPSLKSKRSKERLLYTFTLHTFRRRLINLRRNHLDSTYVLQV